MLFGVVKTLPDSTSRRISDLIDEVSAKGTTSNTRLTSLKLAQFSTECRQLGRSYALILAAGELSEQLTHILSMFYTNARHLTSSVPEPKNLVKQLVDATDSEAFPESFMSVADSFENFRERLNEFREYTVCFSTRLRQFPLILRRTKVSRSKP